MTSTAPILIVEDNLDAADSLATLLQALGWATLVVHDGDAGVRAALAAMPSSLLCDIGLPGISGYEVARRLRAEVGFERLPMAAMTGYALASDRQDALRAGFDVHLPKPLDIDQLLAFLEERVGRPPDAAT